MPFENLDIRPLGRSIDFDLAALEEKIVRRRRGGFCYELNGLFAALLRELGFGVTMLAAGVARGDGSFGPEFDHLTLLVRAAAGVEGQSAASGKPSDTSWLADVGFGDSFREPLRSCNVDQNMTRELRCGCKEPSSVLPLQILPTGQAT